ncbi:MAG: efflux RND transporter periplasmic adaptor subunit [Acidobacteria bacterium]|nr:efflux RND transporter periplasmic adaptor subunit [Acidobacteriota bacterium]
MKRKHWILLGVALLIVLVVVVSILKSGNKPDEVEAVKVVRGDVAPTVTADGLIAAKDTVNISSQVMGEIIAIPFKEGERVKKGDVLVQINPDTYQRDVASAKANLDGALVALDQAKVTLAQRQRDWDRAENLFKQGIYSTSQHDDAKLMLDQAKLGYDSARTMVQQAKAAYQRAQDYLAKTTMLSPINGVVTAVNAKVGETAVMGTMNFSGTVILTVSDLSQIITEVEVDEADFPRLKMGQPVVVTVDALGGKKYDGTVIEISASAQAGSSGVQTNIRQFKVKVLITNPDAQLRPGVTARVKLIADKRKDVLRVPIGAIRTEEKNGEQVFFVFTAEKGKVAKRPIKAGLSDDLYTEVTEGLKGGEEVITGPYRFFKTMREGDRVKVKLIGDEEIQKQQTGIEVHVS